MELYMDDLQLRTVTIEDIEEVARTWDLEKGCISLDEAREAVNYMKENHSKNKKGYIYHLCLAVFKKGEDKIIGWCGLDGKTADKLHIFYSINANYRGRGYATQCARKLISYAFDEANVPFVNGGCAKDNIASYKVMMKVGMKQNAFEENGDPLFFIDNALYHSEV